MERNKNLHGIFKVQYTLIELFEFRGSGCKTHPKLAQWFCREYGQFPPNKGGHLRFTKVARNIRLGWKLPADVKFVQGKSGAT